MSIIFSGTPVCRTRPYLTTQPLVVGWPWTFGQRAVPVIVLQTALCATVVYRPHPGWGLSMLHTLFAPVQFTLQILGGGWELLLSSSSNSSVQLHLRGPQSWSSGPITANQSLTHSSKFGGDSDSSSWTSVYDRTSLIYRCHPIPFWQSQIHKNAYLLNGSILKCPLYLWKDLLEDFFK